MAAAFFLINAALTYFCLPRQSRDGEAEGEPDEGDSEREENDRHRRNHAEDEASEGHVMKRVDDDDVGQKCVADDDDDVMLDGPRRRKGPAESCVQGERPAGSGGLENVASASGDDRAADTGLLNQLVAPFAKIGQHQIWDLFLTKFLGGCSVLVFRYDVNQRSVVYDNIICCRKLISLKDIKWQSIHDPQISGFRKVYIAEGPIQGIIMNQKL